MAEESAFPRKVLFWVYAFLLSCGVILYVIFGVVFNEWNIFRPENSGLYAVFVLLVGFGLVGMLLYRRPQ
jgi:hypothetical protein